MDVQKNLKELFIMSHHELNEIDKSGLLDGSAAICVPSGVVYILVKGEWIEFGGGSHV